MITSPFEDGFSGASFGTSWEGTGGVVAAGVAKFTVVANTNATVRTGTWDRRYLDVGGRNFVMTCRVTLVATTAGTAGRKAAGGVGVANKASGLSLAPCFEVGHTATAPATFDVYSSAQLVDEIGERHTAPAPAIPLYVKLVRDDFALYAEYSEDNSTWIAMGPSVTRAAFSRAIDTDGLFTDGDSIVFYARNEAAEGAAGVEVSFDDVRVVHWPRFSEAPSLGNLRARAWPGGARIDLSWDNPPAGDDEVKRLTIVRSTAAFAEYLEDDRVVDPVPALTLDMRGQTPQWVPTSATAWAEHYPDVVVPTAAWSFADGYGPTVGAVAFTAGTGATIQTSQAIGINVDGSGQIEQMPELLDDAGGGSRLVLESAALGELEGKADLSVTFIFRSAFVRPGVRDLINKINAAGTSGWTVQIDAVGNITASVINGGITASAVTGYDYTDGAWHMIRLHVDWAAGLVRLWGDLDGEVTGGPLPASGTFLTAAVPISIGRSGIAGALTAHMQVAAVSLWDDSSASLITAAVCESHLWTFGRHPFDLPTGSTCVYSYTGTAGGIYGRDGAGDKVAHWSGDALVAAHFWHGWHLLHDDVGSIVHASLDGRFDAARTNLMPGSEGPPNAATATMTIDGPAPSGLRRAHQIASNPNSEYARWDTAAIAAGTTYTVSFWVRDVTPAGGGGSNAVGRSFTAWARDAADATVDINQRVTLYATPAWRRVSFTFASGAAVQMKLRIYGGVEGSTVGDVQVWGIMVHTGTELADYVPAPDGAASATRSLVSLRISLPNVGQIASGEKGEVRAKAVRVAGVGAVGQLFHLASVSTGATDADSRRAEVSAAGVVSFQGFDSMGVSIGTATGTRPGAGQTTPFDVRCAWRQSAGGLGGAFGSAAPIGTMVDGVVDATAGTLQSWGAGCRHMFVGSNGLGASAWRGGIAVLRVYDVAVAPSPIKRPYAVGLDPIGEVVYDGPTVSAFSDLSLPEGQLFYYTLFPSRVPDGVDMDDGYGWDRLFGDALSTDVGRALPGNAVAGLSTRNLASPAYVFDRMPRHYREADEQDRIAQGRSTGLMSDVCAFMQAGFNLTRDHIRTFGLMRDAERGPLGLVGIAADQTSIVDNLLRDRSVKVDDGLLALPKRRLWARYVGHVRRKGTIDEIAGVVQTIAGWHDVQVIEPGNSAELRFLRTYDGYSGRELVERPASGVTFAAGSFADPGLALSPDTYAGGLYLDWFGNVKRIAGNTATTVTFDDTTFTPAAERTFLNTIVTGGNTATIPTAPNDHQYNDGYIHEPGLAAAVPITATSFAASSVTAAGLINSASTTVAIAAAYTGNYAGRVATFRCWLMDGEHSWLYEPMSDLELRGSDDDPFFVMWGGLLPTGSGVGYPATDDDVIVYAPVGAARHANRRCTKVEGASVYVAGALPNARPGDWINPNRNQPRWWRIVEIVVAGPITVVTVDPTLAPGSLVPGDVAVAGDLATVAPPLTVEHDRAIRSLVPAVLPLNSRVFIYYRE